MSASNDLHQLSPEQWDLLQQRADRFEEALRAGKSDDRWEAYLEGLDPGLRRHVLVELIKIDLDERWLHGRERMLDDYLPLHPELGAIDQLPADLIAEEFRIRKKCGDRPDIGEYYGRFPKQFGAVRELLEQDQQQKPPDPTVETAGMDSEAKTALPTDLHTVIAPTEASEAPARARPSAPPPTDNYQKLELLGQGHFGEVWKGKAPGGVDVAIKVVTHPIEKDAAQREMQALELVKNLRHPCLLATYTFWIENNRLHIVMELADGTLRDRLKHCRKQNLPGIPRDELLMYFADAAEGLDFLHSRKVFHRDIKPDNILLLEGHAKVADFGLARLQQRQMMTVSFAGTPVYMAPESWSGKGGAQSDQYSLAFAYAELRLGKRPIEADDLASVMSKTLETEPDLSGLPPEEAKIVRRALAKKPENRFPRCCDFVAALAQATGTPVRLRSHGAPTAQNEVVALGIESTTFDVASQDAGRSGPVGAKKGRAILIVAAALLLAAGAVAAYHFGFGEGSRTDRDRGLDPGNSADPQSQVKGTRPPQNPADKLDVFIPARFTAVPGAPLVQVGKRKAPIQIQYALKDGQKVEMVLIVPPNAAGLKPYYMMVDKAPTALFAEFAAATQLRSANETWSKAAANMPVTGINAVDAFGCAAWLGGNLPTTQQWDFAAGFGNRAGRAGPSLKPAKAAVGRSQPRPITDEEDNGPLGVDDMSGNGREWTRDILLPDGSVRAGPISQPKPDDLGVLRGRNYTLRTPLTYADLEFEQKTPQTQYYLKGSPYTSFRMVIDLDE